jgi:hypothetical protein
LGRLQDEDSNRPGDDASSDDTSWNISNRETYFGDCLGLCCRRVTYSLYNHIVSPIPVPFNWFSFLFAFIDSYSRPFQ